MGHIGKIVKDIDFLGYFPAKNLKKTSKISRKKRFSIGVWVAGGTPGL
jgi:hypothetical protein